MSTEPSHERRLEDIERRLGQLERTQEDAERREQRRRRQALWTRIALLVLVGGAYVVYLYYLSSIA